MCVDDDFLCESVGVDFLLSMVCDDQSDSRSSHTSACQVDGIIPHTLSLDDSYVEGLFLIDYLLLLSFLFRSH